MHSETVGNINTLLHGETRKGHRYMQQASEHDWTKRRNRTPQCCPLYIRKAELRQII